MNNSVPVSYTFQLLDSRTFGRHIDHICKHTNFYSELDHDVFTVVVEPEEAEVVSPVASSDIVKHSRGTNDR